VHARPGRNAPAWGARGRKFESCRPDQLNQRLIEHPVLRFLLGVPAGVPITPPWFTGVPSRRSVARAAAHERRQDSRLITRFDSPKPGRFRPRSIGFRSIRGVSAHAPPPPKKSAYIRALWRYKVESMRTGRRDFVSAPRHLH